MKAGRIFIVGVIVVVCAAFLVSGCAVNFYKQSPRSKQKISELKAKIDDLEVQRQKEREELEAAKRMLEKKLGSEIADESISLRMDDKGLVIILSDDILFDSGKAEVKKGAYPILDKVSAVIRTKVPDKNIGISGHTDNVPIKHSGWKSNWELSTARATNVLYYLEKKKISPSRLSATGYGKHRPIVSNDTEGGRAKNRRVEILILPEFVEKKAGDLDEDTGDLVK